MHARVTAILLARNGAEYLQRTIEALASQSRQADSTVFVDASSSDESAALLAAGGPTQFVTAPVRATFGAAVAQAVKILGPGESENEWLWLLAHDNAPEPEALAALLHAIEIAPSVAIAGPKLMQWEQPEVIAAFGESITKSGRSVQFVTDELDQGQHDRQEDVLAVAASGMLVRRTLWSELGGFDPGLPSIDAALDFCVRARLAGNRVLAVPGARVTTAGAPEHFGRPVSPSASERIRRAAQLHRRLVYAPAFVLPIHWLLLLPIALFRASVHLAAKRPWAMPGELSAALSTAFYPGIGAARSNLRRGRALGWGAILPLRVQPGKARELAANRASAATLAREIETRAPRPSFFTAGGAWIVILLAGIGIAANAHLLGATALAGGGLAPLAGTLGELWSRVGYGWRDIGAGFAGASDPFSLVLAVLGSTTFWQPSTSVVLLYVLAVPLAGLAAWWCAARFSTRGWAPAIAAVLWALSPAFLASINGGQLPAVIAHLLLPWLVLTVVNSARSWSATGAAALLFAATAACAPVLAPALLLCWVAWMIAQPRGALRLAWIPLPAAVLFAPLVLQQGERGNWLALLADPGLPGAAGTRSGWQLAAGAPAGDLNGWASLAASLGIPSAISFVIVGALLAPIAALAILSLFLPGSRRAIPSLAIALLGFATAVASAHLLVAHAGAQAVGVWPGSGLSLYWLGLIGAVVVALEALGRAVALPALLAATASIALAVPLIAAPILGLGVIQASDDRMLPAIITAEAATQPETGTLELLALADGSFSALVHRGAGTTMDERSTLASTSATVSEEQAEVAELAGNLSTASGLDIAAAMQQLQLGFVLLPETEPGAASAARTRAADALDSNDALVAVGETAYGNLWRYPDIQFSGAAGARSESIAAERGANLIALAVIFGMALVLAIPTGTRRRTVSGSRVEGPADTFEEDENA